MTTQLFLNLPVKDLNKTIDFFTQMGFTFNQQFTDEKATCMVISENIFVMLLVEDYFKTFINKEVCDSSKFAEAISSISLESREKVDELMEKGIKAGGIEGKKQDMGWMYQRGLQDPNGHLWEFFFMDYAAMPTS